ncbi:MAG: hypothetical protein K2L73_02180 [Muribaculaceae bacterium]|nr:hypothetical protein [Barnesiella sp.]MDE6317189.1 hypothetical protein [Muribaculaceae bacterium]
MTHLSLPGIKKIQVIRCNQLPPGLMLHSICGCMVALSLPSHSVAFNGRPLLTWEGTMVNGGRQEKSTLEFTTAEPLPEGENLAFVVTGAGGKQYLIGTREGRFPIVAYSETTGSPNGDAAVRTYKITHIARKSVLPCVL